MSLPGPLVYPQDKDFWLLSYLALVWLLYALDSGVSAPRIRSFAYLGLPKLQASLIGSAE